MAFAMQTKTVLSQRPTQALKVLISFCYDSLIPSDTR